MSRVRSVASQLWPRLAILAVVLAVWQALYESGFFSPVVLPAPASVWEALRGGFADGTIADAVIKSLTRLVLGFGFSIVVGTLLGLTMARSPFMRRSLGSLIVGLQSLPSISWLPLAILWFSLTQGAILFVVIIGALPSVVLGTATAVRQVPPLYERAGRTLGARGWTLWRSVVFPAALPGYVGGLQQGWAFAWRSLMAGELIAAGPLGLGQRLQIAQNRFDSAEVMAIMVVIVAIGMVMDLVVFGSLDHRIRSRRGLASAAA